MVMFHTVVRWLVEYGVNMSNLLTSNIEKMGVVTVTVDLGSVAANTSETETVTVVGVKIGDFVAVTKPTLEAGIVIGDAFVTADDTISVTVMNSTASAVDAASEAGWLVFWARPTSVRASVEG